MESEERIQNTIFNDKRMDAYIDKYFEEFTLSPEQEEALNIWIDKLNNDQLTSEKGNYHNFFEIILEDLLGYKRSDVKHEENIGDEGHPVEFVLEKDGKDYVIIELKGTTYKDLTKRRPGHQSPVEQATNYASAKKETEWATVSNYDEFRFFNPTARDNYISFKFRQLQDLEIFKKFLLVFSKFSLIDEDIPKKLLNETKVIERELENEFYQLYSDTRLMIIKELEYSSEDIGRIEAIKLSQIILNRFIFLCFAEDLALMEEETTADVLLTPLKHRNLIGNTMWNRLNELFIFANQGNKHRRIPAFNGGLFKDDLSNLKIRDEIEDMSFFENWNLKEDFEDKYEDIAKLIGVYKDTLNPIFINLLIISTYDFDSELDVNILGHIFENSISDIEELKNDNQEQRKKDGVYYTPEYITDYICRNTIIPYLSISGKASTVHELLSEYESSDSLNELDSKLTNIKVLDPACGSGSILNKSVDVLFEIHEALHNSLYDKDPSLDRYFDSLEKRKEIISNNIYGVDLNDESVEITKLSLFLKLATTVGIKEGFQLPSLDKHIKCGNSLIDDESIAGDKAFNWHNKFPEVFEDDGFDIIVGNPPYIKENVNKNAFDGLRDSPYYQGKMDIWTFFGCISLDLLKKDGLVSFIAPNNWITNAGASKFRNKVNEDAEILQFRNFGNYKVFDAAGIQTMIYIMKKNNERSEYFIDYSLFKQDKVEGNEDVINFLYSDENSEDMIHFQSYYNRKENKNSYLHFVDGNEINVLNKINSGNAQYLEEDEISQGIVCPQDFLNKKGAETLNLPINTGVFVLSDEEKNDLDLDSNELELIKPYFTSNEIKGYVIRPENDYWVIYTKSDINDKIENFPHIKKHLDRFSEVITSSYRPYGLHRARNEDIFKDEKIIVTRKCLTPTFSYADFDTYVSQTFNVIKSERFDLKVLLGILNSDLIKFWLKKKGKMQGNNYQLDKAPLMKIPIKYQENDITISIKEKSMQILETYEQFYKEVYGFNDWLKDTFSLNLILPEYYNLDLKAFLLELENQNVDTKPRDIYDIIKEEFNKSVGKIKLILFELKELEMEINKLIYELYGLNDEEIEIIENSLND